MKQPKKTKNSPKVTWRRRALWDTSVYMKCIDLPKDIRCSVDKGANLYYWYVDSDSYIPKLSQGSVKGFATQEDAKINLVKTLKRYYKEQAKKFAQYAKVFE